MKSMKPWVALPGSHRLSRLTSARADSRSAEAIHSTALRSNSGSGPCGPNCLGPPSSRDRWPVPMMATRWSLGQDSTSLRMAWPSWTKPGLWHRRGEDVGVHGDDRQIGFGAQGDDRAGDAVVDPQLIAEGQVESRLQAVPQQVAGQLLVAAQQHPGQAELPLFVVKVCVVERGLADQELGHVIEP